MKQGGLVLVVGPDGAGKTTVRHALVTAAPHGMRVETERRALLPRRTKALVTEPHRHEPYSPLISMVKTLYYFADALLSWKLRVNPAVRKGVWTIHERGWWDMAVDPRRYRLRPHPRLFRFLSKFLPRPDLVLVLEGSPELIRARKPELSSEEIARQASAWHSQLPSDQRCRYLDVALPLEEVVRLASSEINELAIAKAPGIVPGWTELPGRRTPRWTLPRGPRKVAASALRVYHPVTIKGYCGWKLARVFAAVGGFRLLPTGARPHDELVQALGPFAGDGATLAVARTNHAGRYIVLQLGGGGEIRGVAKVALDGPGRLALHREAEALIQFAAFLPEPLSAPRIVDRNESVLLFEAVDWQPRPRPWRIGEEVAFALGRFFAAAGKPGTSTKGYRTGLTHGDFAPWNLLQTEHGWVVLDWEAAHDGGPPFYDLFHYVVQGSTLLGHPSRRTLISGLSGTGWIGKAIAAYASGAGTTPEESLDMFQIYLDESARRLDLTAPEAAAGLTARYDLLAAVRRS